MEADAGKGFGCQKIMDGKANDGANALDKAIIPSCCLKARASDPEVDAKCHSTVVSDGSPNLCPALEKLASECISTTLCGQVSV
ncbi:hypothetical protein C3L33_03330, partial [Rhododendron williamsianum]